MSASEIMDLLKQTQAVAEEKFGITNILQPGVIKEPRIQLRSASKLMLLAQPYNHSSIGLVS